MQSVAKRGEASNIFKLSDLGNAADSASSPSGNAERNPAAAAPDGKDSAELGSAKTPVSSGEESKDTPAVAAPAADDALAWLKIIENATADLTADLRAPRSSATARSDASADDDGLADSYAPPSSPHRAARRNSAYDRDGGHDEYSDERKLAQKLSYRYAEQRGAPPQTLRAAVMPYIAATGIFAFIAGSAAAYFLTGHPSPDVKERAVAPSAETQADLSAARPDQVSSKKSDFQRGNAQASSADSTAGFWGPKADEQASKPAEHEPPAAQPLATWSDTVETFKQFVKPEQKSR